MQYREQPLLADSHEWCNARSFARQDLTIEALRKSGAVSIYVMGTSMLPTIWPGDLLRIDRTDTAQITPGDVVLFQREGRFFVHRVQKICALSDSIRTRGDAMPQADSPFAGSQLLGRVTKVTRAGRDIPLQKAQSLPHRFIACLFRRPEFRGILFRVHAWRRRGFFIWNGNPLATASVRMP
jgi:signal peptidase I